MYVGQAAWSSCGGGKEANGYIGTASTAPASQQLPGVGHPARVAERIATLDTPMPYNARLEKAALPSPAQIVKLAERML